MSGMDLAARFRRTLGTRCLRVVTSAPGSEAHRPDRPRTSRPSFARTGRPHGARPILVVHDTAAAEDIAQEAFLAAIRNLDRFDRRRPFGPWLHRIVVNRAIDWARARTLRAELELGDAPATEASPDVGSDVVDALRHLSPEHRAVIVLRHLLGYTPGEIARLLDLPRGTVNSRLRRGLDQLQETLP